MKIVRRFPSAVGCGWVFAAGVGMWKVRHLANSTLPIKTRLSLRSRRERGGWRLATSFMMKKSLIAPGISVARVEPELSHFKAGTFRVLRRG